MFAVAPPNQSNLDAFEAWSSCADQHATFLGDALEGVMRVELKEGQTLLMPSGGLGLQQHMDVENVPVRYTITSCQQCMEPFDD